MTVKEAAPTGGNLGLTGSESAPNPSEGVKAILEGKVQEPAAPKIPETPPVPVEIEAPEPVLITFPEPTAPEAAVAGKPMPGSEQEFSFTSAAYLQSLEERLHRLETLAVKHHSWWNTLRLRFLSGLLPD